MDLNKIKAGDCELSVRTIAVVGRDTPLSLIDGMSDENLRANGCSRRSIKELREFIENVRNADPLRDLLADLKGLLETAIALIDERQRS